MAVNKNGRVVMDHRFRMDEAAYRLMYKDKRYNKANRVPGDRGIIRDLPKVDTQKPYGIITKDEAQKFLGIKESIVEKGKNDEITPLQRERNKAALDKILPVSEKGAEKLDWADWIAKAVSDDDHTITLAQLIEMFEGKMVKYRDLEKFFVKNGWTKQACRQTFGHFKTINKEDFILTCKVNLKNFNLEVCYDPDRLEDLGLSRENVGKRYQHYTNFYEYDRTEAKKFITELENKKDTPESLKQRIARFKSYDGDPKIWDGSELDDLFVNLALNKDLAINNKATVVDGNKIVTARMRVAYGLFDREKIDADDEEKKIADDKKADDKKEPEIVIERPLIVKSKSKIAILRSLKQLDATDKIKDEDALEGNGWLRYQSPIFKAKKYGKRFKRSTYAITNMRGNSIGLGKINLSENDVWLNQESLDKKKQKVIPAIIKIDVKGETKYYNLAIKL